MSTCKVSPPRKEILISPASAQLNDSTIEISQHSTVQVNGKPAAADLVEGQPRCSINREEVGKSSHIHPECAKVYGHIGEDGLALPTFHHVSVIVSVHHTSAGTVGKVSTDRQ